jgi:hypothetical protein
MTWVLLLTAFVGVFVCFCNIIVITSMTSKEMKKELVSDQCIIGKIFANIFYAPAWMLKLLRYMVVTVIR